MLFVFIINPHAGDGRSHRLVERLRHKGMANGFTLLTTTEKRKSKGYILELKKLPSETEKTVITKGETLGTSELKHENISSNGADEIRVYRNAKQGNCYALCRKLAAKYAEKLVVVACGGDGTVNEVAHALHGSTSGMMVIPFGSGNDFSKSIYNLDYWNSSALREALGLDEAQCKKKEAGSWPNLEDYHVDVVEFIDDKDYRRCFVNAVSIGFDSAVAITASKLVRRLPGLGKVAYMLSVIPALFKNKQFTLHYEFLGRAWQNPAVSESSSINADIDHIAGSKNYSLSALTNARYYGGGFQPNPFMNLQDGVIEIVISKPLNLPKIAKLIGAYRKGEAQKHDILFMFSAKGGRIMAESKTDPLIITYDGEALYSSSIVFEVKEKALRLCIPKACANETLKSQAEL